MILCRSYSCSGYTAEALRRIVNTGADTTGGINEGFRRRGRHRSRRLHRLAKAVDPDRPVGIQHQLDDIRFVQQPAESAELALHAFRKPARLFLAS